jgi:hypothetical protein
LYACTEDSLKHFQDFLGILTKQKRKYIDELKFSSGITVNFPLKNNTKPEVTALEKSIILKSHNTFPPLKVVEIEKLGGYAIAATDLILEKTFLMEYLGIVRKSSDIDEKKDDIFLLKTTTKNKSQLCIDPGRFCNLARYISGYPEEEKCNVAAVRRAMGNIEHIYLFSKKMIKKNEILYYNYGKQFHLLSNAVFIKEIE